LQDLLAMRNEEDVAELGAERVQGAERGLAEAGGDDAERDQRHPVCDQCGRRARAAAEPGRRPPEAPGLAVEAPAFTSETVFFLPGAIEISHVLRLQELGRVPSGRRLLHRFMVRGHWRRPPSGWTDPRMLWIELEGPGPGRHRRAHVQAHAVAVEPGGRASGAPHARALVRVRFAPVLSG
jgi:hypothetical protein